MTATEVALMQLEARDRLAVMLGMYYNPQGGNHVRKRKTVVSRIVPNPSEVSFDVHGRPANVLPRLCGTVADETIKETR